MKIDGRCGGAARGARGEMHKARVHQLTGGVPYVTYVVIRPILVLPLGSVS